MYSNEALQAARMVMAEEINGVSHDSLTGPAYGILVNDLESFGNTLSDSHRYALYELVGNLTKYAQGKTTGRMAMALPTGMGKTSAIIAWITALHRLGIDHVSVAVSASKVEALCSIKRALIEHGVPESVVGLKHSKGDKASLPSTADSDRQFMLVTHQRVRGSTEHKLFTQHRGKPRNVMIYDESLFKSDSTALSEREIRKALAWFREDVRKSDKHTGLLKYLGECTDAISARLDELRAAGSGGGNEVINLPEKTLLELNGYKEMLGKRLTLEPLVSLLEVSQNPLRVSLNRQDDGIVFYTLAVPESLKNVMVLDASYPIRTLVKMDDTIIDGSDFAKGIKRFDNVTIHQMLSSGSRTKVTESMAQQRKEKRNISREVAEVIKGIPEDEAILVFTFKKNATDRVDILSTLQSDIMSAGVDIESTTPDGKPRINFLTWGDETSLNTVAYCKNVILAGVLHRSYLDIASSIVGQRDDLTACISNAEIQASINSEIDHVIYQALSRGSCREVDNGQAKPMKAWIIHKDMRLRNRLANVLPGATWKAWDAVHEATKVGKASELAGMVIEYLDALPEDVTKISTRQVKEALKLADVTNMTFTRATDLIHESSGTWVKDGRSLVRVTADLYFPGAKAPTKISKPKKVPKGVPIPAIVDVADEDGEQEDTKGRKGLVHLLATTDAIQISSKEVEALTGTPSYELKRIMATPTVKATADSYGWTLTTSKSLGLPGKGNWLVRTTK
jgi:hypothetical protein